MALPLSLARPKEETEADRTGHSSPSSSRPLPPRLSSWFQLAARQRDWLTALGVIAVVAPVYLRSLMPSFGYSGDAAKWSYLSEIGGVPHETGYPLFVAVIQAWGVVFPFGSPAWRTNLLVSLFAVAAILVFFGLQRLLEVRRSVAAVTSLTFAFSLTFWTQAVIAEVYSLHILFMASIMFCLGKWRLGGSNRWFQAAVALVALSFGNHMSTSLVVPAVAWLAWSDRRRALTKRNVAWVVGIAALGASQYLYLFYMSRVGRYVELPVRNLSDLWNVVNGGQFRDDMFAFSLQEVFTTRLRLLWNLLVDEYFVLLAPIAYGLWRGLRSDDRPRRDVLIGLTILGLGSMIYGLNYNVDDINVFFLPFFFVLAVFLGIGLEGIVAWVLDHWVTSKPAALAVVGGLMAVWVAIGLVDYPRSSQRGNVISPPRTEEIAAVVPANSLILTNNYHECQFLLYQHYIEPERFGSYDVAWQPTPREVARFLRGGRPITSEPGGTPNPRLKHRLRPGDPPPQIYAADKNLARALRKEGLVVTEVGPKVWRIESDTSITP